MKNKQELTQRVLDAIATEVLGFETVETRRSDALDFHEVAVWSAKDGLMMAAYAAPALEAELALEEGDLDRHVELLGTIETSIPQLSAQLYRIVHRVLEG